MRSLAVAAALFFSAAAAAQDVPHPLSIALEPLGDSDHGIVARVSFRFANPRAFTRAGLFLEGSFTQGERLPRNFRYVVPREGDKGLMANTSRRNGKLVKEELWVMMPDKRNEMSTIQTFREGPLEIDVRLVLDGDRGKPSTVVANSTQSFTLAKTGKPWIEEKEEEEDADEVVFVREPSNVTIRDARRNTVNALHRVSVEAIPSVKRVEFWIEHRKILARNAAPFTAELDLGESPENVTLRAVGYDAQGRFVDADAFVVGGEKTLAVKLTRVASRDGLVHVKLTVQKPHDTELKSVALYAGAKKLHEWSEGPYTVTLPAAALEGAGELRAVIVDQNGKEAADQQPSR